MSDTPRVDAMESAFQESGMYGTFSPVALCREFEREITTLRRQVAELEATRNECERQYQDAMDKYIAELDRAETAEFQLSAYREALENVIAQARKMPYCHDDQAQKRLDFAIQQAERLIGDTKCEHGKGLTDYCEPCGRIHGGG
jgi:DNA repair exonuclease SbcCD ATPase subunit